LPIRGRGAEVHRGWIGWRRRIFHRFEPNQGGRGQGEADSRAVREGLQTLDAALIEEESSRSDNQGRYKVSKETLTEPQAAWVASNSTDPFIAYDRSVRRRVPLAADLLQCQLAAFVVELVEEVKAVAALTHDLAGLADVAELLGKVQQSKCSVAMR
jgi:hypothetical protein